MRLAIVLLLLAQVVVVNSAAAQPAKSPRLDVNGDPLPDGSIARLGTVRFQLSGDIRAIALSLHGTNLATATHDPKEGTRIDFLDTSTGRIDRKLDLPDMHDDLLQYTPDGKGLVFRGRSGIKVVDAETGKVVASTDIEKLDDSSIALSSDGKWVAAQPRMYVYDAPVGVWETTTGKQIASLPGRGASCNGLTFSPDGKRLLLWSTIPTQANGESIGFDYNCKVALACIDIDKCKIVGETTIDTTKRVALCQDGETVAFEAADRQSICIRHLPTRAERCGIPVKEAQFAFTPDGKGLFTINETGQGSLWDAAKGNKIRDFAGALVNKDFHLLGISRNGSTIAVLDGSRYALPTVVAWNAATGKRVVSRPPGHEGAVTCLAYAPDGKLLASGSIDRTVRLWNPSTSEPVRILTVHKEAITTIAISADGKLLASSSKSGVIRVCNIADGKTVMEATGSENGAMALAFSQEGTVLLAGGKSPDVLGWEIASAKEIVRLKTGDETAVMAFSQSGTLAVTAKNGHSFFDNKKQDCLQVWDPKNKLPVVSIPMHDKTDEYGITHCNAATFSPGGRMLASSQISEYLGFRTSYGNPRLLLWERASGQSIRRLAPCFTNVLAFSPDGRLLAPGSVGGIERGGSSTTYSSSEIEIWDVVTGVKVSVLPVRAECVAFSPDGRYLATGGRDNCVLIWKTPKIQPTEKATAPSSAELDEWWADLGGEAKDAYQAMGKMLDVPEHAVAMLKERVRPVQSSDSKLVAKLIAQLDSESFTERVEAQGTLEAMGEGAARLLRKALDDKPSLETQRRLEDLIGKCEETSPLVMRHHRAVATLEWIGTPEARALLRTLADGAPWARLTIEARAALKRMN